MKLFIFSFLFFTFFLSTNSFSQDTIQSPLVIEIRAIDTIKPAANPTIVVAKAKLKIPLQIFSHWTTKNIVGFDLSEIAFVNWNAGGTSSISGLFKGHFIRRRSDSNSEWLNELLVRYGVNKQDGVKMRKSDDEIRFNSTFGYRKDTLSNWYFSSKFNFRTQFAHGFKYPDTDNPISKLLAPAYTFLGVGADYFNKEKKFNIYVSPLTFKNTLVLDQKLADQGAFGVSKATYNSEGNLINRGRKSRTEIGFLFTNYYKKEVWKNISMENRLSLYSDYINNFGNIDVDWTLQLDLVVNKYVRTNIGMHLMYDDDVKNSDKINGIQVVSGAKTQIRQSLGVGLEYIF
jgi:hypothetical protein